MLFRPGTGYGAIQ